MKQATTTTHPPKAGHALVLVVDDEEWSSRALESVLSGAGYRVVMAGTAAKALEAVRVRPPHVAFIKNTLPNGSGIGLCRTLRSDERIGVALPIFMTSPHTGSRMQRLEALRAGAWEFVSYPLDAEELLLKLHTYGQTRQELDRLRESCFVDDLTGLYNARGLERRVAEIVSAARREDRAVACVAIAFTLELNSPRRSPTESDEELIAAAVRCGTILREAGRVSDAIGRIGGLEFAVVAPSTDARGAIELAERLARALRRSLDAEAATPLGLFAGFDAVPNVREMTTTPNDLLIHATKALRESRTLRGREWIRQFRSAQG